jgi:hypothetical protein
MCTKSEQSSSPFASYIEVIIIIRRRRRRRRRRRKILSKVKTIVFPAGKLGGEA